MYYESLWRNVASSDFQTYVAKKSFFHLLTPLIPIPINTSSDPSVPCNTAWEIRVSRKLTLTEIIPNIYYPFNEIGLNSSVKNSNFRPHSK